MQIPSYDWFVGREKGKPCLVVATAPSAEAFPYSGFRGIYITCGDGPVRLKDLFVPDYWVNANSFFPVPERHIDLINSFRGTKFVFADSVAYSDTPIDPGFLEKELKVDWFAYDQRHFGGKPCPDGPRTCCELLSLYPGRITLQEFIQAHYGMPGHYSTGSSVALHALAFAILLGCSPIYLQGIELPRLAKDYAYRPSPEADRLNRPDYVAKAARVLLQPSSWPGTCGRVLQKLRRKLAPPDKAREPSLFSPDIDQILSDFKYLVELAAAKGIEVYNLSGTSSLNEIKTLKYKDYSELKF